MQVNIIGALRAGEHHCAACPLLSYTPSYVLCYSRTHLLVLGEHGVTLHGAAVLLALRLFVLEFDVQTVHHSMSDHCIGDIRGHVRYSHKSHYSILYPFLYLTAYLRSSILSRWISWLMLRPLFSAGASTTPTSLRPHRGRQTTVNSTNKVGHTVYSIGYTIGCMNT